MEKYTNFWNLKYNFKETVIEKYEIIFYALVSFLLPFFIAHPQWVIGIIVNLFLTKVAFNFKLKTALPVILFPSLGVLSAGLIFGSNTHFLLYFIPMIWVGNTIYILTYKFTVFKKNINKWLSPVISAVVKSLVLFLYALLLVNLFSFPKVFLIAMGGLQVVTGVVGGYLGVISVQAIYKNKKKIIDYN